MVLMASASASKCGTRLQRDRCFLVDAGRDHDRIERRRIRDRRHIDVDRARGRRCGSGVAAVDRGGRHRQVECCTSPSLVSVRPASCAGVRVQEPSALWMPADSVAPAGTPVIFTLENRIGIGLAECHVDQGKAMAVSSLPERCRTSVSAGASATGVTSTWKVPDSDAAVAALPPSTVVAVTVRSKCCARRRWSASGRRAAPASGSRSRRRCGCRPTASRRRERR